MNVLYGGHNPQKAELSWDTTSTGIEIDSAAVISVDVPS